MVQVTVVLFWDSWRDRVNVSIEITNFLHEPDPNQIPSDFVLNATLTFCFSWFVDLVCVREWK